MSVVPMDRQSRTTGGRVPPHNLAAEESLLGAMLLSRDAINTASTLLSADSFYKPAHGHVFDAILGLHTQGEPSDPVTVADELRRDGLLDAIGGPATLVGLQANTPATSNASSYARIIADAHLLRLLVGVAGEIAELAYSYPDDTQGAMATAEQLLWQVGDTIDLTGDAQQLNDVLFRQLETLERRMAGQEPEGLTVGLADLDRILTGIEPGSVVTIAGRPGSGKSHAGVALTLNIARTHPVLFWSLEMSRSQMADRILANIGNVTTGALRKGNITTDQAQDINLGVSRIGNLPVYLYADAGATITRLRAHTRRMARHLRRPPVVVLDYLQLLESEGRTESRQLEVSSLMRALKRLAIELNTVIIVLAQLNRNVETRHDKRPALSDLRESGSVEQDSSIVIFTYRGDMYHDNDYRPNTVDLIVAKNRDGATGTATVGYQPATGRYWDLHNQGDI